MNQTIARLIDRTRTLVAASGLLAEPAEANASALLSAYLMEWRAAGAEYWKIDPATYPSGRALLDTPEVLRVTAVFVVVQRLLEAA